MDKYRKLTMKRKRDEAFGSVAKRFDECKRNAVGALIGMRDALQSLPEGSPEYDVLEKQIEASEAAIALKGNGKGKSGGYSTNTELDEHSIFSKYKLVEDKMGKKYGSKLVAAMRLGDRLQSLNESLVRYAESNGLTDDDSAFQSATEKGQDDDSNISADVKTEKNSNPDTTAPNSPVAAGDESTTCATLHEPSSESTQTSVVATDNASEPNQEPDNGEARHALLYRIANPTMADGDTRAQDGNSDHSLENE